MRARQFFLASMAASALLLAVAAQSADYALPPEEPAKLPAGRDADLTTAYCSACHSLDYVTTQPRGKGAQFWRDNVTKMVTVYGAPIPEAEADRISNYLAETYGGTADQH